VEVLRRNATALGLGGVEVRHAKVESVLAGAPEEPYDVVLADPPYGMAGLGEVLSALHRWVAPGGLVLVERAVRDGEPEWPPGFEVAKARRYGDTVVYWAWHEDGTNG
jgi:16S rRNA (guanine966-N2)-methyltransferase